MDLWHTLPWLFGAYAVILGAVLGSFLNALLFRYKTGRGMGGRSRCMHCNHTLSALDLVPIFSFLLLRGRCRYCSSRLSAQYLLVEVTAAVLSLGVFLSASGLFSYLYALLIWMVLLFVVVYDIRHKIVPMPAILLLAVFGIFSLFFTCDLVCVWSLPSWWQVLSGPLVASPLLLLSFVSSGRWMGWGDGLLEIGLGFLLGISGGFTALSIAFWIGALAGLSLIALAPKGEGKKDKVVPAARSEKQAQGFTMTSELPFVPFLVLGAAIVYFFHVDLFSMLLF